MLSSPFAALDSTRRRIRLLGDKPDITEYEQTEIAALRGLEEALGEIDASSFSKFQRLVELLQSTDWQWRPEDPADRLVLFSERIETLNWLKKSLPDALRLRPNLF